MNFLLDRRETVQPEKSWKLRGEKQSLQRRIEFRTEFLLPHSIWNWKREAPLNCVSGRHSSVAGTAHQILAYDFIISTRKLFFFLQNRPNVINICHNLKYLAFLVTFATQMTRNIYIWFVQGSNFQNNFLIFSTKFWRSFKVSKLICYSWQSQMVMLLLQWTSLKFTSTLPHSRYMIWMHLDRYVSGFQGYRKNYFNGNNCNK